MSKTQERNLKSQAAGEQSAVQMTLQGMFSRSVTKKRPMSSVTRLHTVYEPVNNALTLQRRTDLEEEARVEEGGLEQEESKKASFNSKSQRQFKPSIQAPKSVSLLRQIQQAQAESKAM